MHSLRWRVSSGRAPPYTVYTIITIMSEFSEREKIMKSLMRKRFHLGVLAGTALALCANFTGAPSISTAGTSPQTDPIPNSRIVQGKKLVPVPLDLTGRNRTMVYLGSYLVNAVGGCNDCHTEPSYTDNPFAGDPGVVNATNYLAGGRHFGPFVSANITPDGSGKPHGLDRDEFVALMRTGYDTDESRYLQVMPWPVYRNMTDQDLHAIYEYLSAIPHAEPQSPCLSVGETSAAICLKYEPR